MITQLIMPGRGWGHRRPHRHHCHTTVTITPTLPPIYDYSQPCWVNPRTRGAYSWAGPTTKTSQGQCTCPSRTSKSCRSCWIWARPATLVSAPAAGGGGGGGGDHGPRMLGVRTWEAICCYLDLTSATIVEVVVVIAVGLLVYHRGCNSIHMGRGEGAHVRLAPLLLGPDLSTICCGAYLGSLPPGVYAP